LHPGYARQWLGTIQGKEGRYCIWRVSETTRESSDVYCQSNNDNDTRTSCAFYEESLQVNHRQNTQKERARYCQVGREGERRDRERVWHGFLSETVILVLTIILNQQRYFEISLLAIFTQSYFETLANIVFNV
jgi:hypothetical protein